MWLSSCAARRSPTRRLTTSNTAGRDKLRHHTPREEIVKRQASAGLIQDARYAIRLLRREPGFTAVAILTMALGIGATTTLFSVAYGVLIKPLPWPHADRLVRVTETRAGRIGRVRGTVMNGTYVAWAEHPTPIDGLAGWTRRTQTMTIAGGEPRRVPQISITPSAFPLLEARPLLGRSFAEGEGARGTPGVALLSYGLWKEQFGGRPEAVGAEVRLDEQPYTIVGVMPREFAFPDREARLWTAWVVPGVNGPQGLLTGVIFSALARLRDGVTPAQAEAEATARSRSAPDASQVALALFGAKDPIDISVTPARDALTQDVRPAIVVLLVAVARLLATATANVASLQLARAATRRHELAIRAAIGAGTARLTRQLLVESGILGLAGGAAGLALAVALHRMLPAILPADFPRLDDVAVDYRVLLFAVVISLAASVVCGVMPAFGARRVELAESLGDGGSQSRSSAGARTARVRTLIMAGQVAVACLLLVGASLLGRSFVALMNADRGYDPSNLLTARLSLPAAYSMERRIQVLEGIAGRLRGVTGVRNAAYGNALPLLTAGGFRAFKMRPPSDPSNEVDVNTIERIVSPGYFSALGLRLSSGRTLSETDTMTAPQVIVVNRSFAARYLGAAPLGAMVPNLGMCRGNGDRWRVVGVGVFGVLSYSVAQRTREIGVRTALGAQARDIVRMIFRQGLGITALGVVTGLLVSAASARSLSTFLFGVTAFDATSFLVVPVVLAVVAVAACLVPARRAARVDPLQALRAN